MHIWSYTIVFFGVAASWVGIPVVGAAVLAAAGALAESGDLDVWVVVAVATAGSCAGGYIGYLIGARAGGFLVDRPGRWQRQRRRALSIGNRFYRRWGPFAVFLTPTWVSGALGMPRRSFLVWNAIAAATSSLVTVFGAYAIARAVLGNFSTWHDLGPLVIAVAVAVATALGIVWYRRRRRSSCD
jgi:membrane protein DedA with SNARE-associated domain